MKLRTATAADAAAISKVYAEVWREAYAGMVPQDYLDGLSDDFWTPSFAQWLESGAVAALMLLDGEGPAGALSHCPARDEAMAGWGEIQSLYLLPRLWGSGAAQRLFHAGMEGLRDRGFQRVYLWVLGKNRRARRFYEKQGMAFDGGALTFEVGGQPVEEVRYTLEL